MLAAAPDDGRATGRAQDESENDGPGGARFALHYATPRISRAGSPPAAGAASSNDKYPASPGRTEVRMVKLGELLALVIGLAAVISLAFAVHSLRLRWQGWRVKQWVRGHLAARYGRVPERLAVHYHDDPLSPVLVDFDDPVTGARRNLRFSCPGTAATLAPVSEA